MALGGWHRLTLGWGRSSPGFALPLRHGLQYYTAANHSGYSPSRFSPRFFFLYRAVRSFPAWSSAYEWATIQPRVMTRSETPHSLEIPVPKMESPTPTGPRTDAATIRYMYQSRPILGKGTRVLLRCDMGSAVACRNHSLRSITVANPFLPISRWLLLALWNTLRSNADSATQPS